MCVNNAHRSAAAGRLSRRLFIAAMPAFLAGCMSSRPMTTAAIQPSGPDPLYVAMYGARPDEMFPLPATDISKVDDRFFRQEVDYHRSELPGTLVVDTSNRFLYLVQEGGKALRYGIGVGRAGLEFEGRARVARKAESPRWTPTRDMIAREPDRYAQYADGMEPGLSNPLGPRALYLFQGNRDTLYRIHGTSEPWSIGLAVSSGCIRMFNQDIIDLYNRVPLDTEVVVLQNEPLLYPQREMPEWAARQLAPRQPAEPQLEPAVDAGADPSMTRRPAVDI